MKLPNEEEINIKSKVRRRGSWWMVSVEFKIKLRGSGDDDANRGGCLLEDSHQEWMVFEIASVAALPDHRGGLAREKPSPLGDNGAAKGDSTTSSNETALEADRLEDGISETRCGNQRRLNNHSSYQELRLENLLPLLLEESVVLLLLFLE
ncbi:hypothetical protein PIB30_004817 [Stylosanthes scabra]|uniref:Uncharacterized protein n=1 Tax=Stylosanthes scabra TaxID=79078 RepID=A0ABU6U2J7_9FABA|nr:hypothetical protein [Stylosanthes scabra]